MFRFGNILYLYFLILVPIFIGIFLLFAYLRKAALIKFGEPGIVSQLHPERSPGRQVFKFVLLLLALTAVIVGISRPQFGSRLHEIKRKGVQIVIALDVSNSMLAEDIQPNRLERAKQAIAKLVDRLVNDRIGLIVFAGDAYVQIPVTTDYVSAKMFLQAINADIVPKQGTAIGSAIHLGMKSFGPGDETSKALIVITDGENHEDDAVTAAQEAAEQGLTVHTIGV